MTASAVSVTSRRTVKADPRLLTGGLFDAEVNIKLRETLPPELRGDYFDRRRMPAHWLAAIIENQPAARAREKSVALNFRGLAEPMVTELVWCTQRQVELGMRISSQLTSKLTRALALVVAERADLVSLLDLDSAEWTQQIRKSRFRCGRPLPAGGLASMGHLLNRYMSILVHAYHRGDWWQLNVWNPLLDNRIPMREHEPQRNQLIYFSHLSTAWLREGAKWWLSRQLERDVYTWSTLRSRQHDLRWFQSYLDLVGCAAPHLADDASQLNAWAQDYRSWLRRQQVTRSDRAGQPLGETARRGAMTAVEQLYRFMVEEGTSARHALGSNAWTGLTANHAVLFRFGDKPTGRKAPKPEMVLSDESLTRIVAGCELLARPRADGGLGDEQLARILKLLIKTGRRVNEITMLDFNPLIAIPFPDQAAHVARLRYQQTKIITGDATILIDQEIVDIIHEQQRYTRQYMAEQGDPKSVPKYLFLARHLNRNGDRPYPSVTARALLNELSKRLDLRDEAGRPIVLSKTHMFRHTKATSLLNAGVPIHVGMRYMGHQSPAMFMHYAQTLAETQEAEFLRYRKITTDGREYQQDPREMFEALALAQRTDRVLPHGYCTLPPRQTCDKGNACLSCTKFVTDQSFEPVLRHQLAETHQLIDQRQAAHTARFGEPMTPDNIWLKGRHAETEGLGRVLLAIESVRSTDGTTTPLRGAGAPQYDQDAK